MAEKKASSFFEATQRRPSVALEAVFSYHVPSHPCNEAKKNDFDVSTRLLFYANRIRLRPPWAFYGLLRGMMKSLV